MPGTLTIDKQVTLSQVASKVRRCKNTSGLELWPGDVVILDATNTTATNICVTLSTTSDDTAVYGRVLQLTGANAYGEILLEGPATLLKVDGNTDIAVGTLLAVIDGATYPNYTTGDVAVNAGGTTVTGNGTTFTAAMKGRKIYFGSETQTYRITAVGGATSLTIVPAYRGAANITGSAYVITAKGIAMKATAGKGGAFAVALEVYTTNDSYGTISAVLFQASRVDSTASQGVVGDMAAAGTAAANAAGASAAYASIAHVHLLGTHTHSSATTGAQIGPSAFADNIFTANAAGRAPFTDAIWTTAKLATGILSADAAGRALVAAGWLNVATFQSGVAAGILTADGTGRAFMVDSFFNAATVLAKFGASSFDATACASVFATNAIPSNKVNWSFGTPTTIAPDDAAAMGAGTGPADSLHVHGIVCAAPSAGLAAADAEGAATSFARSNHVHKACMTDNVSLFFGASDDCGILFSTTPLQDAMVIFADDVSRSIHITDATGKAVDFNVGVATNPTLFIHAATNPATEYVMISVDGTAATIQAVGNTLDLTAVGAVTVNEASGDVDFRVETNTISNGFVCDAGVDAFAFGSAPVQDQFVGIRRPARTATANTGYFDFLINPGGAVTIQTATTSGIVASAIFYEPNITLAGTGAVTLAATIYIDGGPTEGTANYGLYADASLGVSDDKDISFGAGKDFGLLWSTAGEDSAVLWLATANMALHIAEAADKATNWGLAAATNPTVYIHGATTPATEYIAISTDETDAHLNAVGANWSFEIGGTAELTLAANALNLVDSILYGSAASNADLVLHSTSHGTKGCVTIATGHEGLKVGGAATRAAAGAVATNVIAVFNGTPPEAAQALVNGIEIYSSAGECYIMDAAGNATLQSQHDEDGDLILLHFSAKQNKTRRIYLEKLLNALGSQPQLRKYFEETPGMKHNKEWAGVHPV